MKHPLTRRCGTGSMVGMQPHKLAGEYLIAIVQPDLSWKQVYVTGDRHPIYFRAEIDDADIMQALAEAGVEVIAFMDHFKPS